MTNVLYPIVILNLFQDNAKQQNLRQSQLGRQIQPFRIIAFD
jgi:hypothetical protein